MTIDNKELTEEELNVHTHAVTGCIKAILTAADTLNVGRDGYFKAVVAQLDVMAECCTFMEFDLESDRK